MSERGATEAEVEETVRSPFATRPGYAGRTNFFKVIAGYRLRVTLAPNGTVVTVWKEPL